MLVDIAGVTYEGVMTLSDIKLLPHQESAINAVKGFDNVAFYLDMG